MELLLNGQINRFRQICRKALFPSGVVCSNLSKVYSVVLRNKRINWTRPFIWNFQRYLYLLNTIRRMQFSYIVAWILRQWRKMKGTSLRGKLKYGFTYFLSGIYHLNLLSVIKLQWKVAVTLSATLTYTEWKLGTKKTAWWSPAKTKPELPMSGFKMLAGLFVDWRDFCDNFFNLRFSYPMNGFWRFCLDSGKQPLGRIFKEICLKRIPRKSVPEKCLKHCWHSSILY